MIVVVLPVVQEINKILKIKKSISTYIHSTENVCLDSS